MRSVLFTAIIPVLAFTSTVIYLRRQGADPSLVKYVVCGAVGVAVFVSLRRMNAKLTSAATVGSAQEDHGPGPN